MYVLNNTMYITDLVQQKLVRSADKGNILLISSASTIYARGGHLGLSR